MTRDRRSCRSSTRRWRSPAGAYGRARRPAVAPSSDGHDLTSSSRGFLALLPVLAHDHDREGLARRPPRASRHARPQGPPTSSRSSTRTPPPRARRWPAVSDEAIGGALEAAARAARRSRPGRAPSCCGAPASTTSSTTRAADRLPADERARVPSLYGPSDDDDPGARPVAFDSPGGSRSMDEAASERSDASSVAHSLRARVARRRRWPRRRPRTARRSANRSSSAASSARTTTGTATCPIPTPRPSRLRRPTWRRCA